MKFAAIINPEVRKPAPKPVRVDLRKTFLIGCVLWSVALIVSAILLACGLDVLQLLIMCAARERSTPSHRRDGRAPHA